MTGKFRFRQREMVGGESGEVDFWQNRRGFERFFIDCGVILFTFVFLSDVEI
jgi:hypothetical protein